MADILWSDVVGTGTLADGGRVGDLMKLAFAHVANEMDENRLTQAEAGQVYSAMVPAAFQHAISFTMNEELTEANITKSIADAEIAKANSDKAYAEMLASIDKIYGFSYTLDPVTDELVRSSLVDTADGKIDYEVAEALAATVREDKKVDLAKITSVLN